MMTDDPVVEEEHDDYVAMCRARTLEVVEQLRTFRAGRDFEKGSMKIYAPQCSVLRVGLWRSYRNWRRIEEREGLVWHIPVITDPEDLELSPKYYEKARKIDVEKWILNEERAAQIRLDNARSHASAMSSGLGKRSERRFANSTTLAFEKELEMITQASAGKWNR